MVTVMQFGKKVWNKFITSEKSKFHEIKKKSFLHFSVMTSLDVFKIEPTNLFTEKETASAE